MKLRITGTREECEVLAGLLPDRLGDVASVVEISGFYLNRRNAVGVVGRVYAEIRLTGPVVGQVSDR